VTRPWRRSGFDFNYQGELAAPDYDPFEWRPGHELVFTQGYDLVVVTVLAGDSAGTQGHPPVVVTRVDEVLRGAPRSGGMRVIWAPRPLWIPCPVGEEEGIRRWGETPIASPAVGSRWILGGHAGPDSSSWFNVYDCRWNYSDALRQHFIDESAPWAVRIQRLHHKLDELIREAGRRDRAEARRTKARATPFRRRPNAPGWRGSAPARSVQTSTISFEVRPGSSWVGWARSGGPATPLPTFTSCGHSPPLR